MKATPWQRNPTLRQAKTGGIASRGGSLNRRPTGVAKAKQTGDFVEGFTSRIVMAATEAAHGASRFEADQLRVTATDKQHEIRSRWGPLVETHRGQMSFQVMNP